MTRPTLEICRDGDGDIGLEIYIDKDNCVSISISPEGHMNWAGKIGGKSEHNVVKDRLGAFIFRLTDTHVEPA